MHQWCSDCFGKQECLKSPSRLTKELAYLRMFEDYVTKQNALEFYTTFFVRQDPNQIRHLDNTIRLKNNVTILQAWALMNGGVDTVNAKLQDTNVFDQIENPSSLTNDDLKLLANIFSKPEIHGNNHGFILVPLCNFGSKVLKKCSSFQPNDVGGSKKCFTFNGNFSSQLKGAKIGPNLGLNFFLKYRMPIEFEYEEKIDIDLILHEPGTAPDIHGRTNTFIKIKPGKHYNIDTDATLTDVTESFKKMDLTKRGCKINENTNYHEINCYFQQLIDYSMKQCKCVPWYMNNQNYSVQACTLYGFTCFETTTNDKTVQEEMWKKCYPACTYIQYSINVNKIEEFKVDRFDYGEVKADVLGRVMEISTVDQKPPSFSLVKINFGNPRATVITQDAKVTFADMVGSIGGTFGVFLGISFVSLVDELEEWCLWLKRQF